MYVQQCMLVHQQELLLRPALVSNVRRLCDHGFNIAIAVNIYCSNSDQGLIQGGEKKAHNCPREYSYCDFIYIVSFQF